MIKKGSAIFFILLANIILLVHIVVPHHHHKAEVCIEDTHCESDNTSHKQSEAENEHEHDGENNYEFCVLKQFVVIPQSSVRQDNPCFNSNNNLLPLYNYQAILLNYKLESFVPIIRTNADVPLLASSYTQFATIALGLRAPSTV